MKTSLWAYFGPSRSENLITQFSFGLKCTQKNGNQSQNTYHIARGMGKQGMHPPRGSNQPGIEKCTTGSATSLRKHFDGNHAQGDLPEGPSRVRPTKKKEKNKRQDWSREDYKEVMYAFYVSRKTIWKPHRKYF